MRDKHKINVLLLQGRKNGELPLFRTRFMKEEKELDTLLKRIKPTTFKDKLRRFFAKNIPHPYEYGGGWYMPIWWVFFFGGEYDNGNGSSWRPNLYYTIRNKIRWWNSKRKEYKYWQEHFKKYGYAEGNNVKCSTDGGITYHDATPL
jgi:hypothetical protein